MTKPAIVRIVEVCTDDQTKSGDAAEKIVEGNAAALTDGGDASRAGIQELTQAYQDLATKNASNLTAAIRALSAVKTPAEFVELQQSLIETVQKTEGTKPADLSDRTAIALKAALETPMTMNISETIEELPALRPQRDERGKAAGAATVHANLQIAERSRADNTVITDTPCWQEAVLTAVWKLGTEVALTGAARAEVERYLVRGYRP